MRQPARPATGFYPLRLSVLVMLTLVGLTFPLAPLVAAQEAPPSLPLPAPPPAKPPAGYTTARTNQARIYVEPGGDSDAEAFARSWGLLIDDAIEQLETFLPALPDKIDLYVYASEASYVAATSHTPWPEPEATDVLANPGQGDVAVNLVAFARLTPLEGENALRHAL